MTTQPTIHDPRTTPLSTRLRRRTAAAGIAALAGAAMFTITVRAAGADVQAPGHERRDAPRAVGPRLQAILDRAVRAPETTFPGVALYVRRPGHGTWSGAAGKASIDPARPMRAGDRFRAGSITKPFVAAATLQLVEEGKIALDDPLPAVLPARVIARFPDADGITVRMLLNHTSGIAEYSDEGFDREVLANPQRRWATTEFLDRAAALPRSGAPGERHAYSNANYNLLGLVLEQATGKSWRAVVRERVIERLHLTHTALPEPGVVPAGRGIAHGYELVNGRLHDVTDIDSSMVGAAGGNAQLTTTEDLSRFLRALLAGRLFQHKETVDEMRTFVAAESPEGLVGYGLGLERYVLPGGVEIIGHMGTAGGYRAFMFHLPAQDIDLAMAINNPDDPTPVLLPALKLLIAEAS
jgi:D-alanyl-D-alanine carboxypeptidase